ncbi:MAG: hypothetical protein LIP12_10025 [Clostridiales bacterium]|nr:hypothetical protein [Clostridiales bacterium]
MNDRDIKLEEITRLKSETENIASAIENLAGLQLILAHFLKGMRDHAALEECAAQALVSIDSLGFASKDSIVPPADKERVANLINKEIDRNYFFIKGGE